MPPADTVPEEDVHQEALFYIRYQRKIALPGGQDSIWVAHTVRVELQAHTGEASLSIAKYSRKKVNRQRLPSVSEEYALSGSGSDANPAKVRRFPLKKLDQVERGYIGEKEAVRFDVEDEESGDVHPEFRYGHILLLLSFSLNGTFFRLDMCCNSTEERDAWFQWFTDYIVNCELRAVRGDDDDELSLSQLEGDIPAEQGLDDTRASFSNTSNLLSPGSNADGDSFNDSIRTPRGRSRSKSPNPSDGIPERPTQGVQMFLVNFLAGGQSQQAEAAVEADPKSAPDKGNVVQVFEGGKEEKRRLACPETGVLLIKTRIGLTKLTIDLAKALIQVESPWQQTFFINKQDGSELLQFRASSMEVRQKLVDWLIAMRGKPQTDAETFMKKGGGLGEGADDKDSDPAVDNSRSITSIDKTSFTSETVSVMRDRERSLESAEQQQGSGGPVPLVLSGSGEVIDEAERRMMAYPVDEEHPEVPNAIDNGLMVPLVGEWCRVQFQKLGHRPTPKSAFAKRFIAVDYTLKRIVVYDSVGSAPVMNLVAADVMCFTTCSKRFGILALTLHLRNPPVSIYIVPTSLKAREKWIHVFQNKLQLECRKGQYTEQVEEETFKELALTRVCYLCRGAEQLVAVCPATFLLHGGFVNAAEKSSGTIPNVLETLPPKAVHPVPLHVAIEHTKSLLEHEERERRLHSPEI
jgi:hypothetical protein